MGLLPFDRRTDPPDILDPRVLAGLMRAIANPRLLDPRLFEKITPRTGRERASQADLAAFLGITPPTLTKWARGQLPMSNRRVVEASCKLDVSPFWLLGLTDEPTTDWLTMRREDYDQTRAKRHELQALAESLQPDDLGPCVGDRYPGDYRDPDQLIADMITYRHEADSRAEGGTISFIGLLLDRLHASGEKQPPARVL